MSNTDRNASCAERIADHMASRGATISALLTIINDPFDADESVFDAAGMSPQPWDEDDLMETAHQELDNLPLAVETRRVVEILLSTGGPADGLRVLVGDDGVERVTYWFADWFDHAETSVAEESALWSYAAQLAEMMLEDV